MVRLISRVLLVTLVIVGCAVDEDSPEGQTERVLGAASHVGDAKAQSYAELDGSGTPLAIGLAFTSNFLDELPAEPSDLRHCFDIEPIESVFAIESGPCGPEFVRCDQFEVGKKQPPPNYVAPDYIDVEAVAPAMGNHLVDPTSPEFSGEPFTRTWIYGAYDGRITFYEEMVSRAFLMEQPSECFDIKSPPAVAVRGYYPTAVCYGFKSCAL